MRKFCHVLAEPAMVIDLVNRENWQHKAYGQFQAAYTFTRRNDGEVTIVANPAYNKLPVLLQISPTVFPILHDFAGSIYDFVYTLLAFKSIATVY